MKSTSPLVWVAALLLAPSTSFATESGLSLTIRVVDPHGEPIPGAAIRNPLEELRHTVNRTSGAWSSTALYPMKNTEEVPFEAGDEYLFDVSAPGYISRIFAYDIHPRRNVVVVTLDPLTDIGLDDCGGLILAKESFQQPLSSLRFSIDDMERLGDLQHADPMLTASFSMHLLTLGVDRADEALEWAKLAMDEARSELSGPEFVLLTDQMFHVRAVALNLQWQTLVLERLASPTDNGATESERARVAAASVAEEWVSWTEASGTDPTLAQALCYSASQHPRRCSL